MQHANDNHTGLRFLSVCSGIEAASVAWHPLGWKAVAFSEIEKFPSAVLKHHYPDVPNLGDFTKIDTKALGRVDILAGGTPCQAFSVAGLRGGLNDERGNLTLKFVELAHELAANNGLRNVVWENVVGVLSDKGNAFGCFLAGLVGAASAIEPPKRWTNAGLVSGPKGRASWRVFDGQFFGTPQRRRRVIVLADFGNGADPGAVLFERQSVPRDTKQGSSNQAPKHPICSAGSPFDMLGFGQYGKGLTASTCKARDYKDATDLVVTPSGRVRRLTPVECERLQGFPDGYTDIPWSGKANSPDGPRYKALGNSWAVPKFVWLGRRIQQLMPANDNQETSIANAA